MTLLDLDFDFDLFFYPTCAFYSIFNPIQIKREESLIHIATAGGHIPNYVHKNSFNRTVRHELKNSRIELDGEARINPNLESILELSLDKNLDTDTKSALDIYTHDFSEYAKRNCFSFDRTHISYPLINHYHLVAAPPDKNQENKIPNHNSPYLFSFRKKRRTIFLVLENFYEFPLDTRNIFRPTDRNIFYPLSPFIIGYSPFELT